MSRVTETTDSIEGRRAAFAEWVATAENPLTTRAIVNRVWLWHFGQPLAGNPNNFGSTGKKPTHPELLDWLAATFVEQGWSFKKLHRVIMTSEAYRRSSTHPDRKRLAEKDPAGSSYAAFAPRRAEPVFQQSLLHRSSHRRAHGAAAHGQNPAGARHGCAPLAPQRRSP
jgi:hypothetical protein